MISKSWKRSASVIAAGALLIAGATTAQAISNDQINPYSENVYLGWHQDHEFGDDSYDARWDGLYFGYDGPGQIINGLVDTDEVPDIDVSATELVGKIANSGVYDPEGEVSFQIGLYYTKDSDTKWTTLRPVDPITDASGFVTAPTGEDWTGTGEVGALASAPLADLLQVLDADAFGIASYGVYANSPSYVSAVEFDGEVGKFVFNYADYEYVAPEESTSAGLNDVVASEGTSFSQICEGIKFSGTEFASLRYDVEPIAASGGTIEERWADLIELLDSAEIQYQHDLSDESDVLIGIHIVYGPNDEEITLLANEDELILEGNVDGFQTGSTVDEPLELVYELVKDADSTATITGISINTNGNETVWTGLTLHDSVNVDFAGDCGTDEPVEEPTEEPTDEDPADTPSGDDNDDAAKPVVADPKYAG